MKNDYYSTEFIEKFSFPRMAGTEGEDKAQKFLENEIRKIEGVDYHTQNFSYSTVFGDFLLRFYDLAIAIIMIVVLITLLLPYVFLVLILSVILFILAAFGRQIREIIQFRLLRFGKQKESMNFIINLPAQDRKQLDYSKHRNIIIFAHYDSISHTLDPILAGAMFFLSLVGGSFFSLHVILVNSLLLLGIISQINPWYFIYVPFIAGFISLQLFNARHNRSVGTIDNATGVANALYLANYFQRNSLTNTNLIIVFTGVEEFGDIGAYNYIREYHRKLERDKDFFIIVDSVGANSGENIYFYGQGLPIYHYSPKIEKEIATLLSRKPNQFHIKPMYIPPLIHYSTDHTPLKPYGFEFMIFGSNGKIHCEKDNLDNYSASLLDNFNEFSKELIIKLDKNE